MRPFDLRVPFCQPTLDQPVSWQAQDFLRHECFRFFAQALQASHDYLNRFDHKGPWFPALEKALSVPWSKGTQARAFLEKTFTLYEQTPTKESPPLFTGYYEPVVSVAPTPCKTFCIPIYRRPRDLLVIEDLGFFRPSLQGHRIAGIPQNGTLVPFVPSGDLWRGCLDGEKLEIAWARSAVDVFFMHVQGSGVLDDGTHQTRVTYDGTNGHSYVSLGKWLHETGRLQKADLTYWGVKRYLSSLHPDAQIEILSQNPSYVFFRPLDAHTPHSRLDTPLIPLRSLAVDPGHIPLGAPLLLQTRFFTRLFFAQDIGAAIKGPVRGDVFCGTGHQGVCLAGGMAEQGRLFLLAPKELTP